jgi:hypothetical protein
LVLIPVVYSLFHGAGPARSADPAAWKG